MLQGVRQGKRFDRQGGMTDIQTLQMSLGINKRLHLGHIYSGMAKI